MFLSPIFNWEPDLIYSKEAQRKADVSSNKTVSHNHKRREEVFLVFIVIYIKHPSILIPHYWLYGVYDINVESFKVCCRLFQLFAVEKLHED